ncbi:uncharacterized protein SPSK_06526 [Sporothrix schenckii 1099-18]|uniref:Uncharacterized protein n=2 Tax=Sporothrix schenckii TaxID=29908 RepID=U7PUD3_SPOS1|nr:uncharacterized protein SPSK_06526 [Sporothrix schenckii 1099-18]ERS98080.1 hypothetical protein HMPREF1624_04859 [Sporothrix schenckii ATCC 58251]KJR89848.1 hypothetical protein SPSK_06526 [Sporothrix schenckii 1099-18]
MLDHRLSSLGRLAAGLVASLLLTTADAVNFTISNGQIFTPGFAVVDAPQPGTPLGGDFLQVALDVTANGRLPLPANLASSSPSSIHNITIFLYSYDTKHNFTISNGTKTGGGASLGPIMLQELTSTVKHVNWVWPDCLVGNGQPIALDSARGVYNISIRQNFRLNDVEHYTIFDLPISVTNEIGANFSSPSSSASELNGVRPSCASLDNPLLSPEEIDAAGADTVGVLFAPGDATQVQVQSGGADATGDGLGPSKPTANPSDGLGSGGARGRMPQSTAALCLCIGMALLSW